MPILGREVDLYPYDLLELAAGTPDHIRALGDDRRWWAVFTRSRQEKAIARELVAREIPFYLPLVPQDRYIRGRRVQSHLPLFSGYVFLYGNESERYNSLTTNRVSKILPVADGEQLRRDLKGIADAIAKDVPLTVERRLEPGQIVRIKNGPMRGLEGLITHRRGRRLLICAVRFLQTGVSIEIDDFMTEER